MLVCALGDLVLDVVVRLEQPFAPGDDTAASTRVGAGGQAANVAAWAAELGATARLITARSSDGAGRLAYDELAALGVEVVGPVLGDDVNGGVVVSIVHGSGERSMLTDRGPCPTLRPEAIDVGWLRGCDAFHLSGYALLSGAIAEAGARAAGAARAQGARIAVDLASARGITEFGADRVLARLARLEPDVVFASAEEINALGAEPSTHTLVIKREAQGVTVVDRGTSTRADFAARDADVVDSTGAGDALAAGYLVGDIELGLDTAARCVQTVGAMP